MRVPEVQLPSLVAILRAVPPAKLAAMQRAVLWVRDYFVYKDMYNPDAANRCRLLASGRPDQDAFLLLTKALEARARGLGRLGGVSADERHASGLPRWAVATGTGTGKPGRGRRRRLPPVPRGPLPRRARRRGTLGH